MQSNESESGIVPCSVSINGTIWERHEERLKKLQRKCPDVQISGKADKDSPHAVEHKDRDAWGCLWHYPGMELDGQVIEHPLDSWEKFETWQAPSPAERIEEIKKEAKEKGPSPAGMEHGFLFLRLTYLRGFENCMIDMMDDRPEIHEIADRILQYHLDLLGNMHRLCGSRMHGFRFSDDWGTQTDLHISPELWDRFFMPRYRKLFDAVHECGWHVWMHSCGRINKIVGRLVELGVDLLNMWQPRVNGIEEIGRQFAGKVCFETNCDIQKTLPAGNRDEIEAEADSLIRHWGTPEGGFLLGGYPLDSVGAPAGTEEFVLETFRRLDPYRHGWS